MTAGKEYGMPWIETIAYEDADAKLKPLYDRIKGPDNNVDNIMMMHSLRPHSMEGHILPSLGCLHRSSLFGFPFVPGTISKYLLNTRLEPKW